MSIKMWRLPALAAACAFLALTALRAAARTLRPPANPSP